MNISIHEHEPNKFIIVKNFHLQSTGGITGSLVAGPGWPMWERTLGVNRWLFNGPYDLEFETREDAQAYLVANRDLIEATP